MHLIIFILHEGPCYYAWSPELQQSALISAPCSLCLRLNLFRCPLGVFLALGLSGVIPTLHFVISEGLLKAATMGQIGWLVLMACLYITGAALYAARIPERFFPGKCDIWVSKQGCRAVW